jgi:serine/threonine protein kinase
MMAAVPSLDRIAGYKLKNLIGSAGLTETYRGRSTQPGGPRSVALKLLRVDRLPDDVRATAIERFLAAARRAQAASVGGMSPVLDVGEDPADPFVVSELVPGLDLAHLLQLARKRNPAAQGLTPPLVAAIGAQIARVLVSAHEASPPLPHLGLRPSSVRVTLTAGVILVDFGLAAALRGVGTAQLSSWYFLPPELLATDATGGFEGSAEAADVYSLGALLYYLLAGKPPVEARSFTELAERSWEPLPALPGVPADLMAAVRQMTAPEAGQRPPSARAAAELLSDGTSSGQERRQRIAAALHALGIKDRPSKAPEPAETPPARKAPPEALPRRVARRVPWYQRFALLAASVAGVAVAGGAIISLRGTWCGNSTPPVPPPPPPATLPMVEIPPPPAQDAGGLDGAVPLDREYRPMPKRKLPRVPGRLNLDTTPVDAEVWVDGIWRSKTPVDLFMGPGGHRVVVLKEGFRIHRAVYDGDEGEWIRIFLQRIEWPPTATAFVNVTCRGNHRYPILIDDEETGFFCPAPRIPVAPGHHRIAVFVPIRRGVVEVEADVQPGSRPLPVSLND